MMIVKEFLIFIVYRRANRTVIFFFSSRRRHTRFDCDWSSDVCSSDLAAAAGNLRLPRDPAAAARVILTGRTAAIDLGSVERADGTHYFAVCGGTGFDEIGRASCRERV